MKHYFFLGLFLLTTIFSFGQNVNFQSSNLPVLVINTNNQNVPRDSRIVANMGIIDNGSGERNYLTNPFNHFQGKIEIRVRGNSTASWPKKPYDFKTVDTNGDDLDVSLLGMAAHENWILLASYLDHTFIRTPLSKYMAMQTGRWASNSRMVEVVIDQKYQGIYILIEKISRSNRRLGVEKLEPHQNSYPEITGGYIFEISGQKNSFGETRDLVYPSIETVSPEQLAYITDYDNGFRNSMRASGWRREYGQWIDADSFVDELIVQEAMRNSDAYGWSSFFHKNREGKLKAGPVWDFDQSAGNSSYPDNGVVEGWLFSHPNTNNTPFFWPKLMSDPAFEEKVRKRWYYLRQSSFKTEILHNYIDSIASLLAEAQQREFTRWPVLGEDFWRETSGYRYRDTYQKEVDYLKDFLADRWHWMDQELYYLPTDIVNLQQAQINQLKIYPNPVDKFINFEINSSTKLEAKLNIYSLSGELLISYNDFKLYEGMNKISLNLEQLNRNGFYIFNIETNGTILHVGRFIKAD